MDLRWLFVVGVLSFFLADIITAYAENKYKINLRKSAVVFFTSYIVFSVVIYYCLVLFLLSD